MSVNKIFLLLIEGMHRKSLEAAEALKNDESGTSDREDTASKASDISSSGKHLPSSNNNSAIQMGVTCADTISCTSVTPTSASSGTTNVTIHDSNATASISSTTTITASPTSHSPQHQPQQHQQSQQQQHHSHQSSHHLANLDKPKEMNLVTNAQHSNYHHDNDPEAFRWVDYNRDPISFIR